MASTSQQDQRCEVCEGTGFVLADFSDSRGRHYTQDVSCPECDGAYLDRDWAEAERADADREAELL